MLKKLINNPKKVLIFGIIFLIAVFTRFYNIYNVPTFIFQDEMGYLISAISMNLNGSDIVGTWDPLSISPVSPEITALAEVTTQFVYPFYKLPFDNVINGKLPFILISLALPFFIAGIAYEFTKSRSTRDWAFIISLFNPWIWQMGRMSIDPFVSLFFYVVGGYLLLKLKNWQKLWAIPIFTFGFYNYQGHKLVFIFWVFMFFLYSVAPYLKLNSGVKKLFKHFKVKQVLPSFIVLGSALLLFSFYVLVQLPTHGSNERLSTFYTPANPEIASIVNDQRRLSLDSPLNSIIINKYTVWADEVFRRLVETYSYEYLFIEGQGGNAFFSVWNHGFFYLIDSALIFLGVIYLIKKRRYKLLSLLLFGLLVAVIPSLISGSRAYFSRSSLNIPLLIIFASIGASYLLSLLPKYAKYLFYLVYIVGILYFSYVYFIRYPILSSKRFYFTDRILTEYLKRAPKDQEIVVISPELEFSVTTYLFYTDYLNENNIDEVQQMFQNHEFKIDNIRFVSSCLPKGITESKETIISRWDVAKCDPSDTSVISLQPSGFSNNPNTLQINDIQDSGTVFNIYNDKLCSGQELEPYLKIHLAEQFEYQNMDNTEFCKNWITKFTE